MGQAFIRLDAYVQRAAATANVAEVLHQANARPIPLGFFFLVSGKTGSVIEPVLSFFASRFLVRLTSGRVPRLRGSEQSREALAYDLKDFYDFLDSEGLQYQDAGPDELNSYADTMWDKMSPVTGQKYSEATVRRRLSTVKLFYEWAQNQGFIKHRFGVEGINPRRPEHGRFGGRVTFGRREGRFAVEVVDPRASDKSEHVKVMTTDQARTLMQSLGPLPTEIPVGSPFPSLTRDRLIAECARNTGLRRVEVTRLDVTSIRRIKQAKDASPLRAYSIRVLGKGRKWRNVNFPGWLIDSLQSYIRGERAHAVAAAHRLNRDYTKVENLFLNHAHARTGIGAAVTGKTIDKFFRAAQMRGLTEGPVPYGRDNFVFHDLRHTFAVWTYLLRKRSGDTDPIKYIQAQLGHAHRETTEDIYLSVATSWEAVLFDEYDYALDMMAVSYG